MLRYLVTCLALWLLLATSATAQQADPALPPDVRLIIDVSGSMKQNDPANLRRPAVDLLLQLLPEEARAGVWTFGQYVNMLVPHREVSAAWKRDAAPKATQINSAGLFTNIGLALEKAAYDAERASPDYNTSLVLLTDGMVDVNRDPQKNRDEWRRIVDDVLPRLQSAGFTVHTIALSENADTALLDKLAIATGGMSEVADSADQLMKLFLRVFDQAAPAEQVPLAGNRFLVDSSVEEFTALIFRQSAEPTRLLSPDETEYRHDLKDLDVSWYRTDDYDLITLKRPLEGEWLVLADVAPDSRVTVVSDLNLRVKPLPSNLLLDETGELSLLLQDKNTTITAADLLGLLTIDSQVQHEASGAAWPQRLSAGTPPANGIYSRPLDMFAEEGRYQIRVQVDGKSFQRHFQHDLVVRKPFAALVEPLLQDGVELQRLRVRSHSALVDPAQLQLVASIRTPDGRSSIKPLALMPNDEWQLDIRPRQRGEYQLRVRISGSDREGNPVVFEPEELSFRHPAGDDPFAASEAPAVVEPAAAEPPPAETARVEPAEDAAPGGSAEEGSSQWPLYVGLVLGNLLLFAGAYLVYRKLMGRGDDEEAAAQPESAAEPAPVPDPDPDPAPEPGPPADAEPDMVAIDEEDLAEVPAPELRAIDAGLDLASDNIEALAIPDPVEEESSSLTDDELEALLAELDAESGKPGAESPAVDDTSQQADASVEEISLDDLEPPDTPRKES